MLIGKIGRSGMLPCSIFSFDQKNITFFFLYIGRLSKKIVEAETPTRRANLTESNSSHQPASSPVNKNNISNHSTNSANRNANSQPTETASSGERPASSQRKFQALRTENIEKRPSSSDLDDDDIPEIPLRDSDKEG